VVDQIRGIAMTTDDATLPTLVRVNVQKATLPDDERVLATYADTGPIFGLAYDGMSGHHYVGARPRRQSLLGTRQPGQIYDIYGPNSPRTVRPWAALDAGPLEQEVAGGAEYDHLIDRWGLGDLEIDDQAQWLFAMNLFDRRVYRLNLPDGAVLDSFAVGSDSEPWAANARPFALGWHDGWLYHGLVDSREDPALPGSLAAYVYRSRADGSEMTEVFRAALPGRWQPWQEPPVGPLPDQPLLVDIEFRPNGDLILGLRNRAHDVNPTYTVYDQGEILATRREGDHWVAVFNHYDVSTRRWRKPVQGGLSAWWGRDTVFVAVLGAVYQPQSLPHEHAGGLLLDNATGKVLKTVPYAACWRCQPIADSLGDVESTCRRFVTPTPSNTPIASGTPAPSATPSASASPPPTVTPTATLPEPTATPTASPTPTPTVVPRPAYLPTLLLQMCPDIFPVDLVLVFDMSTSMARSSASGRPKYAAAIEAAGVLVAALQLHSPRSDRVAVVGFNSEAWLEIGLTADRGTITAALNRLPGRLREGTRLDLALDRARETLAVRPVERASIVVLLTDGLPNQVPPAEDGRPETTILRAAEQLKGLAAAVITIGLGQSGDIDAELLRAVATSPNDFHNAPDAEDLRAIYTAIAGERSCSAIPPWP
jgi:hypothetical protein